MPFFNRDNPDKAPINSTIEKVKNGDKLLRESFIRDYNPFIIKTVSGVTKRYVEFENSEEYSVGLLAFNEAIDSFDCSKGHNFLKLAEQVIRRRVIDYIRGNQKNNKVYPFTYFEGEENNSFEEKYLKIDFDTEAESIELEEEIALFSKELESFDITLEDLVICAPKHKDSKQLCIQIARILAENKELYVKLIRKKTVPVVELMKLVDVNQKTIERNRKYIIAVCLILRSDLDDLKEYVKNAEQGRGEN